MCEKKDAKRYKKAFTDVMLRGLVAISQFMEDLNKLNITEEMSKDKTQESTVLKGRLMANALTLINDIIHPGLELCKEDSPLDAKDFISYCQKMHAIALDKKLIAPCHCCEIKP